MAPWLMHLTIKFAVPGLTLPVWDKLYFMDYSEVVLLVFCGVVNSICGIVKSNLWFSKVLSDRKFSPATARMAFLAKLVGLFAKNTP